MKILIIRNYPSYMDVVHNTYNIQEVGLARALTRRGHQCDIVLWTGGRQTTVALPAGRGTVRVFYRHGVSALKNTVYPGCSALFRQYDILQPVEYNQLQSWLLAGQYPHRVVIYHGPYYCAFNRRYNQMCRVFDLLLLRRYLRLGTRFIAKSSLAQQFLTGKGIAADRVFPLGVGIDAEMLTAQGEACTAPLACRMRADCGLKLLYIGRFEARRNLPFLLEVFRRVLDARPDASLYLIGSGTQAEREAVWQQAGRLGVTGRIVYQEKLEQKYLSEIYSLADFFLLPTRYEIFGMVLLEAMYYGTTVLTTRNGGSEMLVRSGVNGYVLDADCAQDWAACILRAAADPDAMRRMGRAARGTIAEHFTWDALAASFEAVYRGL